MLGLIVFAKKKLSSGSSGDWSGTEVTTTDKGIISNSVDKITKKVGDSVNNKITEYADYLISDAISVLEIGAIGFGFYHSVIVMFFHNKSAKGGVKPMDKIMLSYFVYFILRILNTVVRVRSGVIGK